MADLERCYCISWWCKRIGSVILGVLRNLDDVLTRSQRYNLKLNFRKCFLFQIECEFLGKKISRDGVSSSPAKLHVDAVKSWPVPTDKREVESFLGYAYYRQEHVQGYAGSSNLISLFFLLPYFHHHALDTYRLHLRHWCIGPKNIDWASLILLPAQHKYCTTHKEPLAVVKICRILGIIF